MTMATELRPGIMECVARVGEAPHDVGKGWDVGASWRS